LQIFGRPLNVGVHAFFFPQMVQWMFFFGSLLLLFFFGLGVAHSVAHQKGRYRLCTSGLVVFALCFLTGLVFEKNTKEMGRDFLFVAVGVVGGGGTRRELKWISEFLVP
jgi:peptidoglycan/LPS O-acetylase OafA/YrhL